MIKRFSNLHKFEVHEFTSHGQCIRHYLKFRLLWTQYNELHNKDRHLSFMVNYNPSKISLLDKEMHTLPFAQAFPAVVGVGGTEEGGGDTD